MHEANKGRLINKPLFTNTLMFFFITYQMATLVNVFALIFLPVRLS